MSKDAYWFKHDSTSGRGLRMRKMAHIYGHWGKGVYWDVIEILRDQSGYSFDHDSSSLQMLADLIGCKDEGKFISWVRDCVQLGLFEQTDKKFYSPILCENMQEWENIKGKNTINGSKGGRPTKPKDNPTNNPNITIIGEERRGDNKRGEEKSPTDGLVLNLIQFEKELRNSYSKLEAAARRNKTTVEKITAMIPDFIDTCKLKDKTNETYKEYCSYFANWLLTEFSKVSSGKIPVDKAYIPANKPKGLSEDTTAKLLREDRERLEKLASEYKPGSEQPNAPSENSIGNRFLEMKKQLDKIAPKP